MTEFKYKVRTPDGKPFTGEATWFEDYDRVTHYLYSMDYNPVGFGFYRGEELRCYGKRIKCHDEPCEVFHFTNGIRDDKFTHFFGFGSNSKR